MRRALVLLVALALAPAGVAQERPGPTILPEGVAHGGLAARAGSIRLNRKVKAEMKEDAPPRPRAPVLKGGKMRTSQPPRPTATPKKKPTPKPAAKQP
jgi:hypothetical protein